MDKKTGIIISVLVLLVIVMVGGAFIADSNDPYIVTIGNIKYEKEDFEKYYKIRYFEEEQALAKHIEEEKQAQENGETVEEHEHAEEVDKEKLKETAFEEYVEALKINQIAQTRGYKEAESIEKKIAEQYDAEDFKRDRLTELGITREDFISTSKIIEKAEDFYARLNEFYHIEDDSFEKYLEENKDIMKGYDFRTMQFTIKKNEEDGTNDKEAVVAKANEILERVKNGEDFETLAKENASSRLVFFDSEIKQINGELESVDFPYLSSYFNNEELYQAIQAIKPGEYTAVIANDDVATFVKLEAVHEGIKDKTRQDIRDELASTLGRTEIYYSDIAVIKNTRLLKTIEI